MLSGLSPLARAASFSGGPLPDNLLLKSEAFDNAAWVAFNGASVVANTTAAPTGPTTADTVSFAIGDISQFYQLMGGLAAGQYTLSVYARHPTATKAFRLKITDSIDNFSTDFTATTTWQRFSYTLTTVAGMGNLAVCNQAPASSAGDVIFWGAQLVTGAVAGTYNPRL